MRNKSGLVRRLYPIIETHIKENIGRFLLINLLNKKSSQIMQLIQRGVYSEAGKFGIEITDLRIKRTNFPKENSSVILRRMQTERKKEAKEIRQGVNKLDRKLNQKLTN